MLSFTRTLIVGMLILGVSGSAFAREKQQVKREKTRIMAESILERLLSENPRAKELFKLSYGYAVFDNLEDPLLRTAYRGTGVVVAKTTTSREYMKMGPMYKDPHPGAVKRQVVFLIRTKEAYDKFAKEGWEAGLSYINALKDEDGIPEGEFRDRVAIFYYSEEGLAESADLTNTKYWRPKKLNKY